MFVKFLTFLRIVLLMGATSLLGGAVISLAMNGVGTTPDEVERVSRLIINQCLIACGLALTSVFLGLPEVAQDSGIFEMP